MKLLSLALATALLASACGGSRDPFPQAFAEAERAQVAGRYAEAARRYDEAAKLARRDRDRQHAEYVAAMVHLKAGDTATATQRLDKIAAGEANTEHGAAAAFRAADLRIEHNDEARGWRDMEALMTKYSSSGVARGALRRVMIHKDETVGKRRTIAYLRALGEGPLGQSELGEAIADSIAIRLAELGDDVAARDAFLDVVKRWPYPRGAHFDDALYRASELDEKLGQYDLAIEHLEWILRERETTTVVGTYQRPKMTPALFRIGLLYRDRKGDNRKAREAFHRLYAEFTTSAFRDDALWLEASLWRADGDAAAACTTLASLAKDFPDSRYVPCAVDQCPQQVKRADKSQAPKACRAYLARPDRIPQQ